MEHSSGPNQQKRQCYCYMQVINLKNHVGTKKQINEENERREQNDRQNTRQRNRTNYVAMKMAAPSNSNQEIVKIN